MPSPKSKINFINPSQVVNLGVFCDRIPTQVRVIDWSCQVCLVWSIPDKRRSIILKLFC